MLFVGKIDETEVGQLSVGMPMEITIGAIQDLTIPATLEYVSPKGVEEWCHPLRDEGRPADARRGIYPRRYSANADIILNRRENVVTIPESAVEFSNDSTFVYLVTSEEPQLFERHPVTIGLSDGIRIEVTEGLKENDKIRGMEAMDVNGR